MALFTNWQDAKISLLTQVYQLADSEEELRAFYAQAISHSLGWNPKVRQEMDTKVLNQMAGLITDKEIDYLQQVRCLARDMMDHALITGRVTSGQFQKCVEYSNLFPVALVWEADEQGDVIPDTIRDDKEKSTSSAHILRSILEEMQTLARGKIKLGCCVQCQNPFVAHPYRPQLYCSDRCSKRARQHRFREKAKTATVTP